MNACRAAGFSPVPLPMLAIEAVPNDGSGPQQGLAVFTSVNAVHNADQIAPLPWDSVTAMAIGPATHSALEALDQTMAAPPAAPFTSESLIQRLFDTSSINLDDGVVIITGQNSRNMLSESLTRVGITVETRVVYRRVPPPLQSEDVAKTLTPMPDIVCVPSNEALDNLLRLAGRVREELLTLPFVFNSPRAADHARSVGYRGPGVIAQAAGDQGQLEALCLWHRERGLRDS